MTKGKTPLAVFTYNRPDHARQVLEAVSKCLRLDECQIYIYCDGARIPEHGAAIEASRRIVRELAPRLDAEVIERAENIGNARSIVEETTKLCDQYGQAIILEDDLVVSPGFVHYMLDALERYRDEPSVYQISGYMFPVEHPPEPDAFFMPLITSWGWATWERAWRIFDWEAAGALEALADAQTRRRFDLDESYPYTAILEHTLKYRNDVWDILFWWSVFQRDGLALHPRQSLVWNGGFDGSGTHCGESSDLIRQIPLDSVLQFNYSGKINLPEEVIGDAAAFDRVKLFLRQQQRAQSPSLGNRIRRKLRQLVQAG